MSGILSDNIGRSGGLIKSVSVSAGLNLVHSTTNTSTVSSISLDNIFTSDYDLYLIHGYNIIHDSGSQGMAYIIKSSDGSNDTGSNYQTVRQYVNQAGNTGVIDSNAAQDKMIMQYDNDSGRMGSFTGYIYNPLSTAYDKHWYGESNVNDDTNIRYSRWTCTYKVHDTAVRGIYYFPSAGNCTHAEFRVYGLATS